MVYDETLFVDGGELVGDKSDTNEHVSIKKPVDEQQNVKLHIENLIRDDNKAEFISFWRSHGQSCHLSPSHLFKLICVHRATKCATAMHEENSGFHFDVNAPLEGGLLPLQLAAQSLSSGLTSILLDHGAQANLCDEHGSIDIEMLPLSMALKTVRDEHVSDWSPGKSIYKLLYIFCLRNLKEPLETIKLLAERTEDVVKVSLYCVEVGEVVQLAALLMVAWNRLIPSDVEDAEKSLIGQHIWRQIALVSDQELIIMINCGTNCEQLEGLKSKQINFVNGWRFLKVLEIGRPVIEKYYESSRFENSPNSEVPYDIAFDLSRHTELILKPDDVFCDDVECLRPKLTTKQKAYLNEAIIKKKMELKSARLTASSSVKVIDGQEPEIDNAGALSSTMDYDEDEEDDEDEALLISRQEPDISDEATIGYLSERLDRILEKDNRDEFVQVINSLPCVEDGLEWIECDMWYWDSANCAAAVLAGETQISDFNACVPTSVSSCPLHYAAEIHAYKLTTLLLKSGFSADTRCDYAPLNLRNVSPLDVALSKLRCLLLSEGYLKGRTSAVKLIIQFFKERVQSILILGLLAENSKEAKHEFYNCLKDGKMLEIGAFLLGARLQLLSPSPAEGEFRSISEMHDFLLDVKTSLSVGASITDKNKLIEMEETLLLLKIFDRIGDKLETLLHLNCFPGCPAMSAASLIEDAGFCVKAEYLDPDNIESRVKITEFRSNVLGRSVGPCKKTAFTTYLLPSWLKGELSVLADKSGSSTRPSMSEAPPEEMNNVSMSVSAPACSLPKNMLLSHLLKRSAPILGALKRVSRRG